MKKFLLTSVILSIITLFASCGSDKEDEEQSKYAVTISKLTTGDWVKMTNHTNYVLSFTENSFTLYLLNPTTGKIKDKEFGYYSINGFILTTKREDGSDGFNNGKEIYFLDQNGYELYFGQLTNGFYFGSK